jgi:Polyketide cyclase / dehydrase and lipid transport
MSPTVVTIDIARPAAEVFAYATDPTRFGEWQQGVIDGHLDTAGPVQVGARCVTTRRIGGANRAVTSVVTHLDPPRTWGVRGIDGPIRATVDLTVVPVDDTSSRLTIAVDFEGHGIGKILVPLLVQRQARKEMPGNIATLKRRVESEHSRRLA